MKNCNVPFPNTYKEKGSSSLDSKRKGKVLLTNNISQREWIIDLGATHHMGTSKRDFSSMSPLEVPHIFLGDDIIVLSTTHTPFLTRNGDPLLFI